MSVGISSLPISETPIAVIDFETTGLTPGADRVIEVSVVRINPGEEPRLVLDTLVNPHRRVSATEIHGITDEQVKNAPSFNDIAGDLIEAVEGCVVSAYNVYFDIKFLNFELSNAGITHEPPHFCLMYMRPMLGLGSRCKLQDACRSHGIEYDASHVASSDALASGKLMKHYLGEIRQRELRTYNDLTRLSNYKFLKSFSNPLYPSSSTLGLSSCNRLHSRTGYTKKIVVDPVKQAIREYWDALKTVVADLQISDEELQYIISERERLGLAKEQIRVLHARAFSSAISQFCDDEWIDDKELVKLKKLHQCLQTLGWAPGN